MLFPFLFFIFNAHAQLTKYSVEQISFKEDSMKILVSKIISAPDPAIRFRSDSLFTRILVRALKIPFSFHYPFDSLQGISRIYSPDSVFRIFTWQVSRDEDVHRRHGAIQMNTKDGALKIFVSALQVY